MEFLLIGTLLIAGSTLVFAGALGLPAAPRPPGGVMQLIDHSRGLVSSVRRPRSRKTRFSDTDVILADLLVEVAELRRQLDDLRSPRS